MTVSLGGITLDDNLQLRGVEGKLRMAVNKQEPTILGRANITVAPIENGGELVLEANSDGRNIYGYFTQSQLSQINDLQAAGSPVTLVHHKGTFTVLIADLGEPEQLNDLVDPISTDKFITSITMYEVGS